MKLKWKKHVSQDIKSLYEGNEYISTYDLYMGKTLVLWVNAYSFGFTVFSHYPNGMLAFYHDLPVMPIHKMKAQVLTLAKLHGVL